MVPVRVPVAGSKRCCRHAHTCPIPNPTHLDRWTDRCLVPGRLLLVHIERRCRQAQREGSDAAPHIIGSIDFMVGRLWLRFTH